MSKTLKPRRSRSVAPVKAEAFENRQLILFQGLLANTEEQRAALSNAIDLWDSIPRYAVSRARMTAMRRERGFLPPLDVKFNYRGSEFEARIYPAQIVGPDGPETFYPSAREELIEHALRKLATEQHTGFHDPNEARTGARFSLHQLRKELESQGHSLRYDELLEGLDILSLSSIEIAAKTGAGDEAFARSTYLVALTGVRRDDFDADRQRRWVAQFHPLVTRGVNKLTYRQFNYRRLMECDSQIARWLLSQLVLKYTQAGVGNSFDMHFSTIRRDSALLDGYLRSRDAIAAVDAAWQELRRLGAITAVLKSQRRGKHGKIEDVTYSLQPSLEFIAEQRAANKRRLLSSGSAAS